MKKRTLFPKLLTNIVPCSIGNDAFRRTTIQAHAKRKTHFKCFKQTLLGKKPGAAPMRTVLQNMNAQVQEKLQKRFNSAYFISKENLALTVDYNVDYNELKLKICAMILRLAGNGTV